MDSITRKDVAIATINLGLSSELSCKSDNTGKGDNLKTLWNAIEADQNQAFKLTVLSTQLMTL
jgi:hypothetical protein